MAEITAALVKQLRDKTSLGMMECKKALQETDGDMDAAIRILRERGALKAAKRADRVAAEGLVAIEAADDHTRATMVEVNTETDFVARNDEFQALVAKVVKAAAAAGATDTPSAAAAPVDGGKTAADAVAEYQATVGEKMEIASAAALSGDVVVGYIHPPGKLGVLLSATIDGISDKAAAADAMRDIAMHIAAFSPRVLDSTSIDQKTLESEAEIYTAQAKQEGKPENIIPRIVEGKVKAFKKENCLVDQPFAKDTSVSVEEFVNNTAKSLGGTMKLTAFIRTAIGEKAS